MYTRVYALINGHGTLPDIPVPMMRKPPRHRFPIRDSHREFAIVENMAQVCSPNAKLPDRPCRIFAKPAVGDDSAGLQ